MKLINYSQLQLTWSAKLSVCSYVPILFKNREIIFSKNFHALLGHWLGGNKLKNLFFTCHLPQRGNFGVFFVHSCVLLFFHVYLFLENHSTFSHEILYRHILYHFMVPSAGLHFVLFWTHFGICSFIFWELFNIFS